MGILFCLPSVHSNTMCCVDVRSRNKPESLPTHKPEQRPQKQTDVDTNTEAYALYKEELEFKKKQELLAEEELW